MSVLQEYQTIRKRMGEKTYSHIQEFLKLHPKYFLSDVYYRESVWGEFRNWENKIYTKKKENQGGN